LPWTLRQGIEHIGIHSAWKPKKSWFLKVNNKVMSLEENNFESSILIKTEAARAVGFKESLVDPQLNMIKALSPIKTKDMSILSSYIYCWADNLYHASASKGTTINEQARNWNANNTDLRGGLLVPERPDFAYQLYEKTTGVKIYD
jgi:hypothetical protein